MSTVDKTELIYELAGQTNNKVTLFTRPRRFGKPLTMSMLESFFDITRNNWDIFDGLDVAKHTEFCDEWMNQYPVLFISFKDVEALNFGAALKKFNATIADLCIKNSFLADSEKVSPYDIDAFQRLQGKKSDATEIQSSLKTIMRIMNAVYGMLSGAS